MVEAAAGETLTLRRLLPCSREEAFDAWTVPDRMKRFLPTYSECFGESEAPFLVDLVVDARVGGRLFALLNFVGDPGPHWGEYYEVDRPRRLAFTWHSPLLEDVETLVTLDFEGRGSETKVVLTHERLPGQEVRRSYERIWTLQLKLLAATLGA